MHAAEELQPQSAGPPASFARMFSSLTASGESSASTGAEPAARRDEEPADRSESVTYESALRRGTPPFFAGGASAGHATAAPEPSKRSASVTLRLSRAECMQLKQRAAEAGLTVSAYIRSCTFEAEALRAQVKQAVQQLRGELRGVAREDLRKVVQAESGGEPRTVSNDPMQSALCADTAGEKPAEEESPRRWWHLRSYAKSVSAHA
jgi:hypothetical protein